MTPVQGMIELAAGLGTLLLSPRKAPLIVRRMRLAGRQPARLRFTKTSNVPGSIEVGVELEATSHTMELAPFLLFLSIHPHFEHHCDVHVGSTRTTVFPRASAL